MQGWGSTFDGVRSIGELPYHTEIKLENFDISLPKKTGISNFLIEIISILF
jgi:hypothetical protein